MRGIKCGLLLMALLCAGVAHAEIALLAWERPPLISQNAQGEPIGLVAELTQALFKRAGVEYQLEFVPLNRALLRARREVNSCMLLVERRQENESRYAWVGPLLVSRLSLYALPDNPIQPNSLAEVRSLSVISHQGSAAADYLQGGGVPVQLSSRESLSLAMLQRGRAPLWASSPLVVKSLVEKGQPTLREVLPFLTVMEDMACSPNMDAGLLQRLRHTLEQLYAEGAVHALYARYGVALD